MRPDTVKGTYVYANKNNISYNDGIYINLDEQNIELLTYQVGIASKATEEGARSFYNVRVSQGLELIETDYTITSYSVFIGNFAALVLTAYSSMAYVVGRFSKTRVESLML